MNKKTLEQVFHDMLKEMYLESDPPIDIDTPVEEKKSASDFYLSQERQDEIQKKHLGRRKLSKFDERSIRWSLFNYGPSSVKKEDRKT